MYFWTFLVIMQVIKQKNSEAIEAAKPAKSRIMHLLPNDAPQNLWILTASACWLRQKTTLVPRSAESARAAAAGAAKKPAGKRLRRPTRDAWAQRQARSFNSANDNLYRVSQIFAEADIAAVPRAEPRSRQLSNRQASKADRRSRRGLRPGRLTDPI